MTELDHHLDAIAWVKASIKEDDQARQTIAASCDTVEMVSVLTAMYVAVLQQVTDDPLAYLERCRTAAEARWT